MDIDTDDPCLPASLAIEAEKAKPSRADNSAPMRYSAYRIFKEGDTLAKIVLQLVTASGRKITIPELDLETFGCSTVKNSLARLPRPTRRPN